MQIKLNNLDDTKKIAAQIAGLVDEIDNICLTGDLGAGKTTFSQFFMQSLGVTEEVTSPTFNLVQIYYAGKLTINHFDLYRLESAEETYELGMDDAFFSSVNLIEWPQIINHDLPKDRLDIELIILDEGQRSINLTPFGKWQDKIKKISK